MRSSKSRSRNKSNRQRTLGNIVNRVFDSSGPEGKVRGTPQQIIEKYLALARDAQLSGDRVAEQSFLQHAEHYTRMLGEAQKEMAERQQFHQPRQDGDEGREAQPNGNGGPQPRDDSARDGNARDNGNGRDHNRRDNGHRDHANRDGGTRDAGHRDGGNRDGGAREGHREQPRPEPVAEVQEELPTPPHPEPVMDAPSEGLPDAVATSSDETAGPVETPEAAAPKPARSRAPRAPRAEKPAAETATPRPRRRKAPDGEAKAQETPAVGEE
ncbi:hypothetical protein PARHAE_02291 [Paracoccus haematequi]|uniref:DUF4167 domain-containing protein n=1 Tax=Paracoccus haematequi TaxID=2491866 RepID=A0A3S4GNS8_9RHOB|nr:DUF4167 domain-containing protein [Paracoccus haematequi]VDS09102.1 hypothetical protein PARHAE_02291 [Paracoccus haematequi]